MNASQAVKQQSSVANVAPSFPSEDRGSLPGSSR
jgi:hypothetical protein